MITLRIFGIIFLLNISLYSQLSALRLTNDTKIPSPLILVPGTGGSRAYGNLDYYLFRMKTLVWVNYEYMVLPGSLTKVFKLQYDPKTHKTRDVTDSPIFFPGWGSTETIEELDEWTHTETTYFSVLVNELTKNPYFVRNKTIRGTPYDFRKAPNENVNFMINLKSLVEETYKRCGNQRVVILGHSLGSLYTLYFLKKQSISWKKKYIRSFMSVSGPLGGAVKSVYLHTTGDSLGSPRSSLYFREMQRSFPSIVFLFPKPQLFGKDPIVITPKKNYSAYDYDELFHDMSEPYGSYMYNDTKDLIDGTKGPEGIDEVYCIYSYGLDTPKQLKFKSFPDQPPEIENSDGDHTVNIESLKVCEKWENVHNFAIKEADHMKIISTPEFLNKLKQILYQQPNKKFPIESTLNEKCGENLIRMF